MQPLPFRNKPTAPLDEAWFRRLIAIAIVYRATERVVRGMKFPAYGAQIAAYVHKYGALVFGHIAPYQGYIPPVHSVFLKLCCQPRHGIGGLAYYQQAGCVFVYPVHQTNGWYPDNDYDYGQFDFCQTIYSTGSAR